MPIKVGLDTSFVVGLIDERDVWHRAAFDLQAGLQAGDYRLHIFDCVLSEVISTLARRVHEKRREADLAELLKSLSRQFPKKSITWLYPDIPGQYDQVLQLVEQSKGELNFNDALIAIACRERRIPLLASFDADFDNVAWLKRAANAGDLAPGTAGADR
jgi:predicted nucleic acid-binding protein